MQNKQRNTPSNLTHGLLTDNKYIFFAFYACNAFFSVLIGKEEDITWRIRILHLQSDINLMEVT